MPSAVTAYSISSAPTAVATILAGCRWLPAPLHLGPSFLRFGFLKLIRAVGDLRGLWRLARTAVDDDASQPTIGQWLRANGQSARAIEWFWSVVLVSASG